MKRNFHFITFWSMTHTSLFPGKCYLKSRGVLEYRIFLLLLHWTQQLYCMQSLYPPRHLMTTVILSAVIEERHCSSYRV